jgi:hypothetical protein
VQHRASGRTGLAFYEPGELAFESRGVQASIRVDRSCVLFVADAISKIEVSVADPAQTNKPIRITVKGVMPPFTVTAQPKDGRTQSFERGR